MLVLLFVIGMHLSLRAFKSIYRTVVGATSLQIAVSVSLMLMVGEWLGWPVGRSILFGFVLALSSTAVGIKMLEDIGKLRNETGRCAVGVLIAQDLAVVPMLILVAGMGGEEIDPTGLVLKVALAVLALAGLIWALSRRHRIHLPFRDLLIRHPDLAPVVALTICFLGAAVSGALELSSGLGAFLAGLYVGNTTERPVMVRATKPVQSLLLMMFFLSIGLLIDLSFVSDNLETILLLVGFVFLINSVINVLALRAVGEPWRIAFIAGFALAQVGEFAFILSDVGQSSGLIGDVAAHMVVSVIAISMIISPLWLELARRLHALRSAPAEGLGRLLVRLYRAEARLFRLRSGRAIRGTAQLTTTIGEEFARIRARERGERGSGALTDGPCAPTPPDRTGSQ